MMQQNNFVKLLINNYKIFEKDNEIYFKYDPLEILRKRAKKFEFPDNPFRKLASLNLKMMINFFKKK